MATLILRMKSREEITARKVPGWRFFAGSHELAVTLESNTLTAVDFGAGFSVVEANETGPQTATAVLTSYYASHHGSVLTTWKCVFDLSVRRVHVVAEHDVDVF